MHGISKMKPEDTDQNRPRRPSVVILGAGFAGLNATLALKHAPVDITLIDRRNHHLFQPLLYQVATAGLSPAQIATPIRRIVATQRNVTVLMDRVKDIDLTHEEVITSHRRIPYDYLVVATGARHTYFGRDDWEAFAPGLKKIDEAIEIRRRILLAFEQAEISEDTEERRRLLSFAIIGGGPTGLEMAGAVAELAKKTIIHDFRNIDPRQAQVVLIEAGPRILPSFSERLSDSARRQLEKLGVQTITNQLVTACDQMGVTLKDGSRIHAATIIWAAGIMASPAAKWLKAHSDRAGRVVVEARLHLPGHSNVFVIGDTASVTDARKRLVPGVAPAAKQMGRHVARAILARLKGREPEHFIYRDYGDLATIGRKSAVAHFGRFSIAGLPAWFLWSFAHIWFLVGFRNRVSVFFDWIWSYVTYQRGSRLITGGEG
jgi:NADH dehydrogenase